MADFYPLLSRAVSSLPDNTPDARAAIYERARAALGAQLRALDPPLSEADIAREQFSLEETIRRIEDEQTSIYVDEETANSGWDRVEAGSQRQSVDEEPAPVAEQAANGNGAQRPRVAAPRRESTPDRRKLIAGGVLALAVVAVAGLAFWVNRVNRKPQALPPAAPQTQPAQKPQGKFDERAGGDAKSPAQLAPAQPSSPGGEAGIPVSQRAILYEETPDNPQVPRSFQGHVVWRLDSASVGQGRPVETVVRADVDIPDAGLTLSFVLRRNTDASLPASHTIEMTFGKSSTGPGRKVRDVGLPQFKTEESARGAPLSGVPVPVMENVFLIGLSNVQDDVERNLDLIKTRSWIDIPIRYSDGQRAVIAVEKGVSGDRAVEQALDAWKNQQ